MDQRKLKLILKIILFFGFNLHLGAETLRVGFYNVENLFDSEKDRGKNDWAYLPKETQGKKEACQKINYHRYRKECLNGDWTSIKVDLKVKQIAKSLESIPLDILGVCEVENEKVLNLLSKEMGLKGMAISHGPDKRGIDVGLLYRQNPIFKKVLTKEHRIESIDYFKKKPTRPILEVEFQMKKGPSLHVFINHWPSLSNPTKARISAAKVLRARVEKILKEDSKASILAMGDFNTIDSDYPHPFKEELLKGGLLSDVHQSVMNSKKIDKQKKKSMPLGTYFYTPKMQWNLLDRFFVSSNLMDLDSYQIHNPSFLTQVYEYQDKKSAVYGSRVVGIPARYNHHKKKKKQLGYSDHFAILGTIQLR
jgi:endonuclease/exonuclease/phosphatase family metal-dependent hydrolase